MININSEPEKGAGKDGQAKVKKILFITLVAFLCLMVGVMPDAARKRRKKRRKKTVRKKNASIQKKKKRDSSGLSLNNRIAREKVLVLRPNRHGLIDCLECHVSVPTTQVPGVSQAAPLKYGTIEKLCVLCHPPGNEVHPTSINPSEKLLSSIDQTIFPLGKQGSEAGILICTSCHDVHMEMGTSYLLRGMPIKEGDSKAMFQNQQDFCQSCHGEEITKLSPHYDNEIENLCRFCHLSSAEKAENVYSTITPEINRTCNFCHDAASDVHYLRVNPFADKDIKHKIPGSLPLVKGAYTCITCHYSHKGEGLPQLLRSDYVAFAEQSRRIRPHWTKVFCLSCHDTRPEEGKPVTFKFGGDMVKVCNWCHDSNLARGFLHRVNHEPPTKADGERYKFVHFNYEVFKLNDEGKVTCITCHRRECEQDYESTGKLFLRGGPYKRTTDVCFQCHVKEVFRGINCHIGQLDEEGKPIIEKCLFCHAGDPTREIEGIRQIDFVGQIRLLCMRCHDEYDHPGSDIKTGRGANHLAPVKVEGDPETHMKPLKEIPLDILPLVKGNMMTCSTCHNSHQAGVLEGKAAVGAGEKQRRRMDIMKGELCEACHTF